MAGDHFPDLAYEFSGKRFGLGNPSLAACQARFQNVDPACLEPGIVPLAGVPVPVAFRQFGHLFLDSAYVAGEIVLLLKRKAGVRIADVRTCQTLHDHGRKAVLPVIKFIIMEFGQRYA